MKIFAINSANKSILSTFEVSDDSELPKSEMVFALSAIACAQKLNAQDITIVTEVDKTLASEIISAVRDFQDRFVKAGITIYLTRRETEVLEHVRRHLSNKEIAFALNLSVRTIKFHVSSLLVKFDAKGRSQLAAVNYLVKSNKETNNELGLDQVNRNKLELPAHPQGAGRDNIRRLIPAVVGKDSARVQGRHDHRTGRVLRRAAV